MGYHDIELIRKVSHHHIARGNLNTNNDIMSKINLILSIALTIVFASAIVLGTYDAKNSYIHNVGHYSKGFNTYGPVVTKCNKCFRQFPSEQKSCNAFKNGKRFKNVLLKQTSALRRSEDTLLRVVFYARICSSHFTASMAHVPINV